MTTCDDGDPRRRRHTDTPRSLARSITIDHGRSRSLARPQVVALLEASPKLVLRSERDAKVLDRIAEATGYTAQQVGVSRWRAT